MPCYQDASPVPHPPSTPRLSDGPWAPLALSMDSSLRAQLGPFILLSSYLVPHANLSELQQELNHTRIRVNRGKG